MKKIVLICCLALLTGCSMFKSVPPTPPLKESEVPYRLQAGTYIDTSSKKHIVDEQTPRWSVSEAYLYDSVINTKPVEKPKTTINWNIWISCTSLLLLLLLVVMIIVVLPKRSNKNQ